jgi:hypothetical protein
VGVERINSQVTPTTFDPPSETQPNLPENVTTQSPTSTSPNDNARVAELRWNEIFVRQSILRQTQLPATTPTRQPVTPSVGRAELERRAQHIFDRFRDDGFLNFSSSTSYSEIAGDLEGLSAADVATLKQIYAERFSPQRDGRDLLTDISRELGDSYDRFRALSILNPESVRPQFYPATERGQNPRILMDPPAGELATGSNITYRFDPGSYIASGPPRVRVFSVNDPAAVRNGTIGETSGVREGYEGSFTAAVPGRHTIVFEVQWGDQPPQYYTYNQVVRTPEDLARSNLLKMPGTATDPDLYLNLVDQQITTTEARLNELRGGATPARPDEQKNLEELLRQLRETRDEVPAKLFDGAIARPIPLQAVLVVGENSQPIPLQLYAKPLANNRWAIVDLTNPTDSRIYEGSGDTPEAAIRSAWSEFISANNLPAGQIAATPPRIPPGYDRPPGFPETLNFGAQEIWNQSSDGQSGFKEWANGLGVFSLAAAVVGVGLLFVPGGQPFALGAFALAGVSGAASGGLNIYDRVHYGNFEWWSLETGLDLLSIVGGLASAGGAAAGITNILRAGATTATLADGTVVTLRQADRFGRFVAITTGLDQGSNVASGVIIGAVYLDQISRINSDPNLTPEQKQKQTQAILNQAMVFGGIVIIGGGLGGRRLPAGELDNLLRTANFSTDLESLVRQSPGLQRALQEQGPERLRELHANYIARQGSLRVQSFEEYVWRNGVATSTDRIPQPLDQAISNFRLLNGSREVNEAILANNNPALLDALRAGNLPPRVETAVNEVLNRNYNFSNTTDMATARARLSGEINSAIGRNIETVADLRRVLGFMEGVNRSGTSGSIGEYFYETRIAQGRQSPQQILPRDLFVSDRTRAPEITSRRPDYLVADTRRSLDIKTGYQSGDFDRNQLLDYNDLVKASHNSNNTGLQTLLQRNGIQGGLTGHDYLFLPNGNSNAQLAAQTAYSRIQRELPQDARNFGVYYLKDDGNIYRIIGKDQNGQFMEELVGPRFPR